MVYKSKNLIFNVKCKKSKCKYNEKFEIDSGIMGKTEHEVEMTSKKIIVEIAKIKHDNLYKNDHSLIDYELEKVSCVCEAVNFKNIPIIIQDEAIVYKEFKKDEVIFSKDQITNCICEIVKGNAYSSKNKDKAYHIGENFGQSDLFINKTRIADIISGEDGTTAAFYNIKKLNEKDPLKAKELYSKSMDDVFEIISNLEEFLFIEEDLLIREKIENNNNEIIKELLRNEIMEVNDKYKK
jgi:hypothetical protein